MTWIGLVGNACAKAPRGNDAAARSAAEFVRTDRRVVIRMASFDHFVGGEREA